MFPYQACILGDVLRDQRWSQEENAWLQKLEADPAPHRLDLAAGLSCESLLVFRHTIMVARQHWWIQAGHEVDSMALIEANWNPRARDLNIFRLVALIASTLAFGSLYSVKGISLCWSRHEWD